MFLELAEALDCPRCRDGYGLVTFVSRAERRRVLEGHLGCPMCEVEFPIEGGILGFGPDPSGGTSVVESDPSRAGTDGEATAGDRELAMRVAALLGPGEGPGRVVLLGPGLGGLGPTVAGMAERVEILAWLEAGAEARAWDVEELARGVNPVRGADRGRWPVRAGALHGVALSRPDAAAILEAVRALRPEGRLVLLSPDEDALVSPAEPELEELASDASAWVGRRR